MFNKLAEHVGAPPLFAQPQAATVLTGPCRTSCGTNFALTQLEACGGSGIVDARTLAACTHVQRALLGGAALASLAPLGALRCLTHLEAPNNRLTRALDLQACAACRTDGRVGVCECACGSLRSADLSSNAIDALGSALPRCVRLTRLLLDDNRLSRLPGVSSGLAALTALRVLGLRSNQLSNVQGLEGLCSLQELCLAHNRLRTLAPLQRLTALQQLDASHNLLTELHGVHGMDALRRLDVQGNGLRCVEALRACRCLPHLEGLAVADNPLCAVQSARLHVVHLLPQVTVLDGAPVTVQEQVDAASMTGADAAQLAAIRRRFFPAGELPDGGGAIAPTSAGLLPSRGEEEAACSDAAEMLEAVDAWARSTRPELALGGSAAGGAAAVVATAGAVQRCAPADHARPASLVQSVVLPGTVRTHLSGGRSNGSSLLRASDCTSYEGEQCVTRRTTSVKGARGLSAIATRLAAGCARGQPWAQLHAARVCYAWVVAHVPIPWRPGDDRSAPFAATWDVGRHLFGEGPVALALQEAMLPGHSGTWAECVTTLLVALAHACGLEAVQLSGWWREGLLPGERLAAHNHAWVALKTNGRWRLLDPVHAIVRPDDRLPFFVPPEAFQCSRLPFQPAWQLVPAPLEPAAWWDAPCVSLSFAAVGGCLLDGSLRSVQQLPECGPGERLPSLVVRLCVPLRANQRLSATLLDAGGAEVAAWPSRWLPPGHGRASRPAALMYLQPLLHLTPELGAERGKQLLERQQDPNDPQQHAAADPSAAAQLLQQQSPHCELWVSPPAAGAYTLLLQVISDTPGWLSLAVEGLAQPLSITLRQAADAVAMQVLVPPPTGAAAAAMDVPAPAWLPRALAAAQGSSGLLPPLQLLDPEPSLQLEADRMQPFRVCAPGACVVAVGSDTAGWQPLAALPGCPYLHTGNVKVPRSQEVFVAVQLQASGTWMPQLLLRVAPPTHTLVTLPPPRPAPVQLDPNSVLLPRALKLLRSLDVDADGVVSRADALRALRRPGGHQLADQLLLPHPVRAADDSYGRFLARFATICASDRLGCASVEKLHAALAAMGGYGDVGLAARGESATAAQ